jgi:hypothetical protein
MSAATATMADVIDMEPTVAHPLAERPTDQAQRPALQSAGTVMTPGDLLRIVAQNGGDIATLERIFDLQTRFEEREAEKAFVAGMSGFKREPIEIYKRKQVGYKTREGDFVGYKHAQLSDVTDAIGPAMARHGLSFAWDIQQNGNTITVDCVVTHERGHSKKVTMTGAPDTSGKKNAIQQVASTVSYLQRYTLLAVTGMSTKDEDDDGQGGADDPAGGGGDPPQSASAARPAQPAEPKLYDDAKFNANKDSWREIVKSKRKSPGEMIKFIESKGALLSASQKEVINGWAREPGGEDDK